MAGERGRPSTYSQSIADEICERLAQGQSLLSICELDHMPGYSTVWRWNQEIPEFRDNSAHARKLGTHYMADDCIRIADSKDDPADKRIRIDTRLRLIGKWNKADYGDRTVLAGDKEAPIQTDNKLTIEFVSPKG